MKNYKVYCREMIEASSVLADLKQSEIAAEEYEDINRVFEKVKENAYNITLSLQVQDITSQQLAAVNHLIQSVQDKLSSLIINVKEADAKELKDLDIDAPTDAAFNPNARYTKSSENQEQVDNLINEALSKTSQDEIDKLFS